MRLLAVLIMALSLLGSAAFSVTAAPGTASNAQPTSFQDDPTDDDDGTNDGDDGTEGSSMPTVPLESSGLSVNNPTVRSFSQSGGPAPVEDDGRRLVYALDGSTYLVTMVVDPDG